MWASTHNEVLHEKMNALLGALKECQMSIGTGYLSAFPSEFFDRFEAIEYVWAPYYTIHKVQTITSRHWIRPGTSFMLNSGSCDAAMYFTLVCRFSSLLKQKKDLGGLCDENFNMELQHLQSF